MTDQPKWTKGPWAGKGQTSEDAVFCGTMHRICADGAWLAFVPTWEDNPDEASEAEANAHLIAAAPDMYAALDDLLASYAEPDQQICCGGHGCGCRGASVRDLAEHHARTAIAKARGAA